MTRPANQACRGYKKSLLDRRQALAVGGAGLLGLNLASLAAAAETQARQPPARAKSVIFLYQFGGPSHLETFDMKPDAPDGIRGLFSPIASNVPGTSVCQHLPQMARVMDKVCLVRSVHHEMKNHNSASYYALTGRAPPVDDIRLRDSLELFPAYGSIVDRLAPVSGSMPTFVAYPYVLRDGSITPGQHASFLGKAHDPLLVTGDPNRSDFRLPELSLPANLSAERLHDRRELQRLVDRQSRLLESSAKARGFDAYYDTALDMLNTPKLGRAFDLSQEPAKVRERYGRHTYGQSCFLARRLVESGVKFVSVYFSDSIGGRSTTEGGWDTHGFDNTRMFPIIEKYHLPTTDQTLPALLGDLDERGLLDETLVVWFGEFGRTPRINASISRDHWPSCYTVLMAGGGLKRGYIHGASDRTGSLPGRDGVRPENIAATMFYLLGIDPRIEILDKLNRPLPIAAGSPVLDLVA
jgi:hypothetical protein